MKKEVQRQWFVEGSIWPTNFGIIEEKYSGSIDGKYNEKDSKTHPINKRNIHEFPTLENALEYYLEKSSTRNNDCKKRLSKEIQDQAEKRFPSYFKKKK